MALATTNCLMAGASEAHGSASYADYAGDKAKAFWHFDREMAMVASEYHKGKFTEPDPSLKDGFFGKQIGEPSPRLSGSRL